MNKESKFFLIILVTILLLFPAACKSKKEQEAVSEVAIPSGELTITYVSPKGRTEAPSEVETIVAIFDHAMVPLEALPEGRGPSVMQLEPSFSGKHRWLNPKTLTFTPDRAFPYSTRITVTIPAGTKTFDGYVLKDDFSWAFQTMRPRIIQHYPQNEQKWIEPDTEILLVFNQPVAKDESFFAFKKTGKDIPEVPLEFALKTPSREMLEENSIESPPENALLIRPKDPLELDSKYAVSIAEGLPGEQGDLGTEKAYAFSFETYTTFQFISLETKDKHNPQDSLKFIFSNPVKYNEFIKQIRLEPEVTIPEYYEEWDHSASTLWVNLPLQPETPYKVWIDTELRDIFGNSLAKQVPLEFQTASYPASLSMPTYHRILEADSELKYPLYVTNTPEILVEAAPVSKKDIIPLLNNPRIFAPGEKFTKKNFFRAREKLQLPIRPNRKDVFPLDLRDYFTEKHGSVFLQLDTFAEQKWSRYPKALLQITNLGLSTKCSPENNLVWVTELRSGQPVPEVAIEIRDDGNRVRWRGKTDKNGWVETPGWKGLGIKSKNEWSPPRQWIFATRGDDFTFINSEWGTGLSPYKFGIPFEWNPQEVEIQGYIFTERGLYRAGETVHIKGIIRKREKGAWKRPAVEQVACEVSDSFNKVLLKQDVGLDSFGSFAIDVETTADASLGTYQIKVDVPSEDDEKKSPLYSSFRIEAFKPAEFEVLLRSRQEEFIFGDDYEADVRASYLFGGAMASQKVSWHLRLEPSSFDPPGYEDFIFGDQIDRWERYGRQESRLLSSGEDVLDRNGQFQIKAKLIPEKEKNSVYASLEATVQGPSRRSISNRIQTLVHKGEFYIGLQPSTTFLPKGKELAVQILTVKPDGQKDAKRKVTLKLIRREWHSVRKAGIGGRFRWISEQVDTEIESRSVKTQNEPQQVTFLPEKAGFYLLEAEGKDRRGNAVTTKTYFYVIGEDYIPWERQDQDIVELIADRTSYQPGDVARILVKSPYERANALVTVEREFVLHSEVREIVGSSSRIEIPIESDYLPNVYVSVLLVQGRTAPKVEDNTQDLGKPAFKLGYTQLNVDPSEKRLAIDMEGLEPTYRPGEEVIIDLKVKDQKGAGANASVAVAVVDVGVLNLIGFKTPDPFSQFYGPKPLAVRTSDARPFVLEQLIFGEKGQDMGGAAAEMMRAGIGRGLSEIELRGDFRFTAYWNPSVLTDDEGNARVTFRLPDNLTTFRVMAVAQTQDSRFGRKESYFKVTKPLLMNASLPRFGRVGDEFSGGVVIHNQTTEKAEVVIDCQAEGILFTDEDNRQQVSLSAGESQEVLFGFRVERPGTAAFKFRALMGDETDGLELSIPLKLPRPTETVALHGEVEEATEEKIQIPEDVYPEESRVDFTASASALSGLKGSVDFLTDYPYLCIEQRLSSILPYIVAGDVLSDFGLSKLSQKEMDDNIKTVLKEIYDYQRGNGGFGLWPDSSSDSPFNSCYAAFALAMAKKSGFAVEENSVSRLVAYLKTLIRGRLDKANYPYGPKSWKTVQAFALYALALFDQPEPSYAEKLFMERDGLSLFGKTLLLKALNKGKGSAKAQNTMIQELVNKAKVSPTSAHFEDDTGREGRWIYASHNRTTAFILQSLVEVGSENPLLSSMARWLVEQRKAGKWSSTQENFYVFYALSTFYRKYEKIVPDFKIAVSLAGKRLLEESFTERGHTAKAEASVSEFEAGQRVPLTINKSGDGIVYYQTRMTYAPKKELKPRVEGFSIVKDITGLDGQPLDSIQAGTLAVVTLQLILTQESLYVVVDDPLPAGFEAVNPVFRTESEEQQRRMEEMSGMDRGGMRMGQIPGAMARWKWWQGFNHIEMYDDRVLLFADSLAPGIHTHRYLVRALTYGTFSAPGTKIEEMYEPEVFGRSGETTIKIVK